MLVGILGLQGDVKEHVQALIRVGTKARLIKGADDLDGIDGLIIPGGESTTITKLILSSSLKLPIKALINQGLPVWGTCAGVIVLCKGGILESVDTKIEKNAYGPQINSFIQGAK